MMLYTIVAVTYYICTSKAQTVSFGLDRSSVVCKYPVTLGCFINPFSSTDATWYRNGTVMSQCGDNGFCTDNYRVIGGVTYTFLGNVSGIYVTIGSVPYEEKDISWQCFHGTTYSYTFSISCSASDSSGFSREAIGIGCGVVVFLVIVIVIPLVVCICLASAVAFSTKIKQTGYITLEWSSAKKLHCIEATYDVEVEDENTGHIVYTSRTKNTSVQINRLTQCHDYHFRVKATGPFCYSRTTNIVKVKTTAIVGKSFELLNKGLIDPDVIKNVKWFFGGTAVIADGTRYKNGTLDSPELTIVKISLDDAGIYSCKTMFKNGSYKTICVDLKVADIECTRIVGEPVELENRCWKDLQYIKTVKWYFGKKAVTVDGSQYKNGTSDNHALVIPTLARKDAGIYSCKVMFENGTYAKYVVQLEVVDKQKAIVGDSVELLNGELKNQRNIQEIEWYFGGTAVIKDATRYNNGTSDNPALIILKLSSNDAGMYSCKIMFANGYYKNYGVDLEVAERKII